MPSTATITAFYTFSPAASIKSSEHNTNFNNLRGHLIAIDPNTATAAATNTYDLGASDKYWRTLYSTNVVCNTITVSGIELAPYSSQEIHVQDQKAANAAGGASVSGDQTRTLNTVVTNTIVGASLSSNQVSLPAGTYMVWASAPCYAGNRHRVRVVNASDSTNLILGTSEYADKTAGVVSSNSIAYGTFTIAATKLIKLTHYIQTVQATNGLGNAVNDTFVEVYAQMYIKRIAS